ncbi:MAG: hotdog fold thioesterase [Flavobacteriales bacterium]|nr:hotdog fold thioesterase [Flavobacteriales bacterium]
MRTPQEIVDVMMANDKFSQWLNLSVDKIGKGLCEATCVAKSQMLNGFDILHGGITYSISDSLLAFASNSYGYKCLSIETSISHTKTVKEGEKLIAKCTEINRGKSIGIYNVDIFNEEGVLVSKFKGSVFISKDTW